MRSISVVIWFLDSSTNGSNAATDEIERRDIALDASEVSVVDPEPSRIAAARYVC